MHWVKRIGVFLTVWIFMALIAYGIALKDYSKRRYDQLQNSNGIFHEVIERSGRISWTDSNFSGAQVALKIEGNDEVLTLKKNMIHPQAWDILNELIRVGTKILVQITTQETDLTIIQLVINPGNVFQRNVFTMSQASAELQSAVSYNLKVSRLYITIGISGLFILAGVYLRKIKNNNGKVTKRGQ